MKLKLLFLITLISCVSLRADELQKLDEAMGRAVQNIDAISLPGPHWNLYAHLGPPYVSQYYLFLRWLGRECPSFDAEHFKNLLKGEQHIDGSWSAVHDANRESGDLDSTIQNYWALKAMGEELSSPIMKNARTYILKKGGVERATMLVKVQLALFDQYPWNTIPQIPLSLFYRWMPVNDGSFGQWIGPHLLPIAYFRKQRLAKDLGPNFNLDELRVGEKHGKTRGKRRAEPSSAYIKIILDRQQPRGSWGGYTVATLFCLAALQDYLEHADEELKVRMDRAKERAFEFLRREYLESGEYAYRGVTMDGRYWDSALIVQALSEAGREPASLISAGQYLRTGIDEETGGFCFGEDFWYAPDTDDTAEIILALSPLVRVDESFRRDVENAVEWLCSMQNNDGGWGAFSRNNNGNVLLRWVAKDFEDSADLFDDSSEDVTGHVLEALSHQGYTAENSSAVRRAIRYLRRKAHPRLGIWMGRWGVNYIYGTNAVLGGLLAAGLSEDDPLVAPALDWFSKIQNEDGGFGETTGSYKDERLAGIGCSTPSQTAWVLTALVAGKRAKTDVATKAAAYLVKEISERGKWVDQSTVGTGHPGICYMNYPAYPYAFPLIALARYRQALAAD